MEEWEGGILFWMTIDSHRIRTRPLCSSRPVRNLVALYVILAALAVIATAVDDELAGFSSHHHHQHQQPQPQPQPPSYRLPTPDNVARWDVFDGAATHDRKVSLARMDIDQGILLGSCDVDSTDELDGPTTARADRPPTCAVSRGVALALSPPFRSHRNTPTNHHHQSVFHHPLASNNKLPRYLSTGTTIAGVVIDRPDLCLVVLGADTRATADRMVADKACRKIHPLSRNIFACGAGTAADLDHICRYAQYSLRLEQALLHESIGNGNESTKASYADHPMLSVTRVCRFLQDALYEQGGACQANLIVGGVDFGRRRRQRQHQDGSCRPRAVLRAIHPHGSMDCVAYTALGSGGLAAMAVLESRYRPHLTEAQAIQLVTDAITAGIKNDLGSGSQVDLCVIRANGSAEYKRAAVPEESLPPDSLLPATSEHPLALERPSTPGVNGFGNVPYAIRSRRLIQAFNEKQEEEEWNSILGII